MNFPKRKSTRLKGYDYLTPGMYFLTVYVKDRKQLLGKIVGCSDFDAPQIMLSEYGQILDRHVRLMNDKYSHLKIDKYVIIPNNFHLISLHKKTISFANCFALSLNTLFAINITSAIIILQFHYFFK